MKVKVVIKTDKQHIIDAKKIAKINKTSVSKMFESYLIDLVEGKVEPIISQK
jgi:hypothetical protein